MTGEDLGKRRRMTKVQHTRFAHSQVSRPKHLDMVFCRVFTYAPFAMGLEVANDHQEATRASVCVVWRIQRPNGSLGQLSPCPDRAVKEAMLMQVWCRYCWHALNWTSHDINFVLD